MFEKILPFQKYAKKVIWPFLLYVCLVLKTVFHKIRERALFEKMRETFSVIIEYGEHESTLTLAIMML